MNLDTFLATIIMVSFLVTIVMAVGSYAAYKLRERRRPMHAAATADGDSPYFEQIDAASLGGEEDGVAPRG